MSTPSDSRGLRTFIAVWFSQSISTMGSALTFFTMVIWLTTKQYPQPEQKHMLAQTLAMISLARAIPVVFTAPIAGAWVDRHNRKQTMLLANLASGVVTAILALLMGVGALGLWTLAGIQALLSVIGGFHAAAFDTSYASLVPGRFLPRANGMMQTMWSLSTILAPTVAAALIALPAATRGGGWLAWLAGPLAHLQDGSVLTISLDAVTFFLVAAILLFLQIPSPKRDDLYAADGKAQKSMWADIREGLDYIRRRPSLLWLLAAFTVANLIVSTRGVFQPLILKFNLAGSVAARGHSYETALALLSTMASVGGLAGGIFISMWGGLKARRIYGVLVPMLVFSLGQIMFGASQDLYLTGLAALISSVAIPILNAHSQTIWQSQTPLELQGRVFAVRRLIAQCTLPLGTGLAGLFGGLIDVGMAMALSGGMMFVFCLSQFLNQPLLAVESGQAQEPLLSQTLVE